MDRSFGKEARLVLALVSLTFLAADWPTFRGPDSAASAPEAKVPTHWTSVSNVAWMVALPGAGDSSPITWGDKVFVTSYSGYGLDQGKPGDQKDLRLHLLSVDLETGNLVWARQIEPRMPEQDYRGFLALHGYASSTPATDGEKVYMFAGQTGVFAFTMAGKPVWKADVGSGLHEWGSGTSVVLHQNLVIVNAGVESGAIVALNKTDGKEAWRFEGIKRSWSTPVVAAAPGGRKELIVSMEGKVFGLAPDSGEKLWECAGVQDYVCPSVVAHDGIAYVTGGRKPYCMAVRLGGSGDVLGSHVLWQIANTPKVATPLVYEGRLYWIDQRGRATCIEAASGKVLHQRDLEIKGRGDKVYASLVLAGGQIYGVTRESGTIVLKPGAEFEEVTRNDVDDPGIFNATPAVAGNRLLLRSDRNLYCISE